MSYQVIARKWRPQTFEDVIGQDAITQTLRNAIVHDRLHHAYLFSGARGVGKTTTARLLAKAFNCRKTDTPNPKPCNTGETGACVSCIEIAESRSLDVFEFDAASHTGVDDIREIILESINVNPARDRFKVFIIDEVHMLTRNSFNALLKTIEEPPPMVVFIMATTELHKVPDTILSRCQQFDFRTIPVSKIYGRIKEIAEAEKIRISVDALREISRSGEGSMRDAQSNFDQVISFSGETIDTGDVINALGIASAETLTKTMEAIADKNPALALAVVEDLVERGHDLRNFCRDLLTFMRDLLVTKLADDAESLVESAVLDVEQLKKQSAPFREIDLIRFFHSIAETETKMRDASEPRYLLEIGLIKLIEMRNIAPIEDLVKRLAAIEDSLGTARDISVSADSPHAAAMPEKKTLTPKAGHTDPQLPAFKNDAADSTTQKSQSTRSRMRPQKANESRREDESRFSGDEQPSTGSKETRAVGPITIDPDAMPVRLEPISAKELEHVEDKRLDDEFEAQLEKEGDDLSVDKNAKQLIDKLLGRKSSGEPASAAIRNKSAAATAAAPAKQNRALEILAQMTDIEEKDDEIPALPEDLDDHQALLEYAEKHPLVKKVTRIFRGSLVDVKRD